MPPCVKQIAKCVSPSYALQCGARVIEFHYWVIACTVGAFSLLVGIQEEMKSGYLLNILLKK